jgi:chromosome segregation ATPase
MLSPEDKTAVPFGPGTKETPSNVVDTLDTAGQKIMGLIQRATGMAEENSKQAFQMARRLADRLQDARGQLQDARGRIEQLEADIKYYQERAVRADQWMAHISSEIQQRLLSASAASVDHRDAPGTTIVSS